MTKDNDMPELIMPSLNVGDIATVIGKYAPDWDRQKLLVTGVKYCPKRKTITYQTHPAEAPSSEGGTDEWTEDDLILCKRNPWHTRTDLYADAIKQAREALERSEKRCEKIRSALDFIRYGSFYRKDKDSNDGQALADAGNNLSAARHEITEALAALEKLVSPTSPADSSGA